VTIESFNRDIGPDEVRVSSDYAAIPPGAYVALEVTDTGAGMDEETRARAFEPFFSTKGTQGTGLGLSTVYGIVKQSGGFISLESEKGRGTRVLIYLPQSTASEPRPVPAVEREPPGGTERILVVEDEAGVRSLVESVLGHHGYQVRSTNNPTEALDWIRRDPDAVDLLISDVVMPHMSGPALADAAQRVRPGLPVLFMSGYANDPANRTTVPSTAPFVQKPFTRVFLLERIRELLDAASRATPRIAR
jgi:two-component system, cell cycle sensor histidine kinase and response regulator CckA